MLFRVITSKPIGITLVYLLLGLLWITSSDQIAYLWFGENTMELTSAQLIKGMIFVIITSFILFLLIRNLYNRLYSYRDDLYSVFSNPQLTYIKIKRDGEIIQVSDTIKGILGFDKSELKKKNFKDIIPEENGDFHRMIMDKLRSKKENNFSIQGKLIKKDGSRTWVEMNGSVKKQSNEYYLLSIHDISEQKDLQGRLRKELREKKALINNTEDIIYSVDEDLKIVTFNKAFVNAFHKATSRDPKSGDSALLSEYEGPLQDKWKNFYLRALKGEKFTVIEEIPIKDSVIITENNFYPIHDNDDIKGVSVYSRDITQLHDTQSQLREKEEYLQVIADHANEAVFSCDHKGALQFANKTLRSWLGDRKPEADLSLWPQKYGLYQKYNDELLTVEDMAIFKALKEGKIKDHEFLLKRNDGRRVFIRASGSALFDSSGNKIGAMVIWSDISAQINREIEIANATLEALEKEREEVASELHDSITQLLGVVNMNLKNLALEIPKVNENQRYNTALKELDHAIEETRNTAYRIMPKSIKDFGLVSAIEELIDDIQQGSELKIKFEYSSEVRFRDEIELNLFRIVQEALNNIVVHSNASKVEINLSFTSERLQLNILDNGDGFDPEDFSNGMGIRSMQNRANKLHGNFSIQRRQDHKGMLISVHIPLKSTDE